MTIEDWVALQPIITSFVLGVALTIVCMAIDNELKNNKNE